jgi:hypothetical protein
VNDEEGFLAALEGESEQVIEYVARARARRRGDELLRQLDGVPALPSFTRLDKFLAVPDPDTMYRVNEVLPVEGNILMTAQQKAGKTTMRDNLMRSLVDGDRFLDRFEVQPVLAGRSVAILDNELAEPTLRRWMRDQTVSNVDRVQVVSLQGRLGSFDILSDRVRAEWANMLEDVAADVIIFDCLRPALDALGMSEDKEASRFAEALSALKFEAGAKELVLVHHMGHDGQRSRGDSGLQGWCTAEWKMQRTRQDDPSSPRSFSAYGRDVDFQRTDLSYDTATRRLSLAGENQYEAKGQQNALLVSAVVMANPGSTAGEVDALLASLHGVNNKNAQSRARQLAVDVAFVRVEADPLRKSTKRYFPVENTMWSPGTTA